MLVIILPHALYVKEDTIYNLVQDSVLHVMFNIAVGV
jgi:hypothetical protein